MDRDAMRRPAVLVASRDATFIDVVGTMVADAGFRPEFVGTDEPAWLTMLRTQPCVVVADRAAPVDGMPLLAAHATARRVPVLLLGPHANADVPPTLAPRDEASGASLPAAGSAFPSAPDEPLPASRLRLVPREPEVVPPRSRTGRRSAPLPAARPRTAIHLVPRDPDGPERITARERTDPPPPRDAGPGRGGRDGA